MIKFYIPCLVCQQKTGIPNFVFKQEALNDEFCFLTTCSKGHKSITVLQNERFQLLFDMACNAYLNGDYKDSVTNAASAVERFHEYFIKVVELAPFTESHDLYFQHYNKFLKIWKQVDNQTERQTGGFLMLYFCVFNDLPPKYLDNNTAGFRNKVVHKGHLPKQDKTLEYLEKCYMYMLEIIGLMRTKYNESMLCLALCENKIKAEKMNSALNLPVQTIAANSVINLNGNPEELNKISFETALKSYSKMNKSIENLEKIGPYNKFFEYLFKNKCKNT